MTWAHTRSTQNPGDTAGARYAAWHFWCVATRCHQYLDGRRSTANWRRSTTFVPPHATEGVGPRICRSNSARASVEGRAPESPYDSLQRTARPYGSIALVGTSIGHYHIVESLGKGGMGEVYVAEDTRLGRRVALKVLARDLAIDADRRERFEREARAVAALNHPNIVTIYSVEEADGVPFLTLELVEGRTLDALIPPGGLPVDRLLAYAIPLADAVGAAHQRGITHRDLKPGNVMISDDGRVKVLDFGLAKLKESNASLAASLPTQELTGEGRIVGTVAYMSPEQAEAKPVDPRSDVFSLGVVIFEMATSQRPFKGDTQVSLLSSIIKDTPSSLTDLRADLPRDLGRIVRRCLSKDPEDRYQTAKDLRNDLRALKEDLSSGAVAAATSDVHALPAGPQAARNGGT